MAEALGNGTAAAGMAIILFLMLGGIGAYDVLVSYRLLDGVTVSSVIHRWSTAFPVMPLLVGLLLGHLFWPIRP